MGTAGCYNTGRMAGGVPGDHAAGLSGAVKSQLKDAEMAMQFRKVGKTRQLAIEGGEDLEQVLSLDESLWMATSAPIAQFAADRRFLAFVDTDADARIHSNELREAIGWLLGVLSDRSLVSRGVDAVPLSAIRSDVAEGRALLDAADYVLAELGECAPQAVAGQAAGTVSLEQVRRLQATVQSRPLNGDGVIVPAAAEPRVQGFVEDIIACTGGVQDASGVIGLASEHVDRFMAAVAAYVEWRQGGNIPAGASATELMPLGEATAAAWELLSRHAAKVDLFFQQCRVVGFNPLAAYATGWKAEPPAVGGLRESPSIERYLEEMPIAAPVPRGVLPLREADLNPAYRHWVRQVVEQVASPLLGRTPEGLSEDDWHRVKAALAPYGAYRAEKKGAEVEGIPWEKLLEYRDGPQVGAVRELIAADGRVSEKMKAVAALEKLLLYHRNLLKLANNFVSFPGLYERKVRALFEMGSAVLDGRWFNFAVRVDNVAAHSSLLRDSRLFTLYLEITGAKPEETFHVAVPVTWGIRGNLAVGKRGVFFNRDGREFSARVEDMVENPISVREALAAPFVRLGQMIAGKIEKLSTSAEKGLQAELDKGLQGAAPTGGVAAAPAQPQQASGAAAAMRPGGMLLGAGVAFAALGSAFAYITKTLAGLHWWQIGVGLAGVALAVMVPVSLLAVAKLRRQDLSVLLEGCGWAVNARMRLTRPQRRFFTCTVPYPAGAKGAPPPVWVRVLGVVAACVGLVALGCGLYRIGRAVWDIHAARVRAVQPAVKQPAALPPGERR